MSALNQSFIAPEDYLERERNAAYKSEYFQGEVFAMAGASTNHNAIKENVSFAIGSHLRRSTGCRNYSSDQRILVEANGLYTYPDLVVICGPNQYSDMNRDTLTNPCLLGEILSPGTAAYDRGEKFRLYRGIPGFQEYLLIDSTRVRAEVFRKNDYGFWYIASEAADIDADIVLESIGLTLTMRDAYRETEGIVLA
nr:Uma2 family endonuclease [uncultured Arsenicibacter sp.]